MGPRSDCRHFLGHRPCGYGGGCQGCREYRPWKDKCLIIKLSAKGDVLRTTPLAAALKEGNPDRMITWLTDPDTRPLLWHNPHIDRLLPFEAGALVQLGAESFDSLICLDKEPRAAALASALKSAQKSGFGWNSRGFLEPLDAGSEHLFMLGLSDELKFRKNRKSYQQLIVEAAGLQYTGQRYHYAVTRQEAERAEGIMQGLFPAGARSPMIGLNVGTGRAFPTKAWPVGNFVELIRAMDRAGLGAPLLMGGPAEKGTLREIGGLCPGVPALSPALDLRSYAAVISKLDMVVSSDTLAMHLGIALERKTVALFGPTCEQEVDLYGRGEKLSLGIECSPCYRSSCPEARCMGGLTAAMVLDAIERNL